jgi:hypothetical protein
LTPRHLFPARLGHKQRLKKRLPPWEQSFVSSLRKRPKHFFAAALSAGNALRVALCAMVLLARVVHHA